MKLGRRPPIHQLNPALVSSTSVDICLFFNWRACVCVLSLGLLDNDPIDKKSTPLDTLSNFLAKRFAYGSYRQSLFRLTATYLGGSVAEWSACWTQGAEGPGLNRSRDAVG